MTVPWSVNIDKGLALEQVPGSDLDGRPARRRDLVCHREGGEVTDEIVNSFGDAAILVMMTPRHSAQLVT